MIYVIVILATWRLSSLFAIEDGPFDIFERIRVWLDSNANEKGNVFRKLAATLSVGIRCVWCNSIWFSAITSLVVSVSVINWMLNTLFISSMVIVFQIFVRYITRMSNG